jgi:hypothetical protein
MGTMAVYWALAYAIGEKKDDKQMIKWGICV